MEGDRWTSPVRFRPRDHSENSTAVLRPDTFISEITSGARHLSVPRPARSVCHYVHEVQRVHFKRRLSVW